MNPKTEQEERAVEEVTDEQESDLDLVVDGLEPGELDPHMSREGKRSRNWVSREKDMDLVSSPWKKARKDDEQMDGMVDKDRRLVRAGRSRLTKHMEPGKVVPTGHEKEETPPPCNDRRMKPGPKLKFGGGRVAKSSGWDKPTGKGTILHYITNLDLTENDDLVEKTGTKRRREKDDDEEVLPEMKKKSATTNNFNPDLGGETKTSGGAKSISGNNPKKQSLPKSRKKKTIILPRGQLRMNDLWKSQGIKNSGIFPLKD